MKNEKILNIPSMNQKNLARTDKFLRKAKSLKDIREYNFFLIIPYNSNYVPIVLYNHAKYWDNP